MNFKLEDRSEYTRPAKLRKTKKTPSTEIRWKTLSDPCSEPADAAKKDENTKKKTQNENNEDIMPFTGQKS